MSFIRKAHNFVVPLILQLIQKVQLCSRNCNLQLQKCRVFYRTLQQLSLLHLLSKFNKIFLDIWLTIHFSKKGKGSFNLACKTKSCPVFLKIRNPRTKQKNELFGYHNKIFKIVLLL